MALHAHLHASDTFRRIVRKAEGVRGPPVVPDKAAFFDKLEPVVESSPHAFGVDLAVELGSILTPDLLQRPVELGLLQVQSVVGDWGGRRGR